MGDFWGDYVNCGSGLPAPFATCYSTKVPPASSVQTEAVQYQPRLLTPYSMDYFISRLAIVWLLVFSSSSVLVSAGNYVVGWGSSGQQTNVPPSATNVMAIAAGATCSLALKSDGSVIAWGQGGATNRPAGLSNVVAIAAGGREGVRL